MRFIHESVGTDAIVERYIEGRELYVGILGNQRLAGVARLGAALQQACPRSRAHIATERVKWSRTYQQKHGIKTGPARRPPRRRWPRASSDICKRVYRTLDAERLRAHRPAPRRADGEVYVLEANPNPQLAHGEDFAESARARRHRLRPLLQRIVNLGLRFEPSQLG